MDLHESKRKLDMMIMVGMSATDSILEAMRRFSYSFKNADLNKADGILKTYKEYEGKHFTNESKFIRYNRMKRSQELTHISVSNSELRIFERLCRDYGVDMCYLKRPDNLEELFERSQRGEQLSKTQQDILNAFTVTDINGNKILKNDASLIIFNTLDLDVMDPSVFPGTGTPEPGGVDFLTAMKGASAVCGRADIIGCDVTELCPPCDPTGASTAAACKIVREMLIALAGQRKNK